MRFVTLTLCDSQGGGAAIFNLQHVAMICGDGDDKTAIWLVSEDSEPWIVIEPIAVVGKLVSEALA